MTGIRAYLNRSVIKNYICIRYAVILVYPTCVEGKIAAEGIAIKLQRLGTFNIIIPTVEDAVKSFGLGNVLQRIARNKQLLGFVDFVGKIIECNRSA